MGMFSAGSVITSIEEEFKDPSIIESMIIVDEVSRLPYEKIQEFCQEGGIGEQLVEEGKMSRRTLVRLSKKDDISRRKKQMVLQLAKEHNDPLYEKLKKNRIKEREIIQKLVQKYGNKGETLAKQAQRDYLKKPHFPKSFMRSGGEERIGD